VALTPTSDVKKNENSAKAAKEEKRIGCSIKKRAETQTPGWKRRKERGQNREDAGPWKKRMIKTRSNLKKVERKKRGGTDKLCSPRLGGGGANGCWREKKFQGKAARDRCWK